MNQVVRLVKEGAVIPYLMVGIIVFGADYLAFFVCYQLLEWTLAYATGVAYIIGLVTNFALLRYWAFAKDAQRDYFLTGTLKYATWLGINFVVTYFLLKVMQDMGGISPYLGKFVVAGFMTFWNYAGYRIWVFNGPKSHKAKFRV